MSKSRNEFSLAEALDQFLDEAQLRDRALAHRAIREWPQIVGKSLAEATKAVWWQQGVFHLELTSPLWKHELSYRRQELARCINEYVKASIATDVVLH